MKTALFKQNIAKIVFDTADVDSSGVSNTTTASHGSGFIMPKGAIIKDARIQVNTTFTSAGADAGTIAVTVSSAGDLVAATAISDSRNIWDAGMKGTLVTAPNLGADAAHDSAVEVIDLFGALPIVTSAPVEVTFTVASQALTAGKCTLFIEYWL